MHYLYALSIYLSIYLCLWMNTHMHINAYVYLSMNISFMDPWGMQYFIVYLLCCE